MSTSADVSIRCRSIWKLYGDAARPLVHKHGDSIADLDDQVLSNSGVIAAVRDVSIDVRKGEIFVIMGLSGSGKSTVLRCMTGLIEPTLGDLSIDGVDLRKATRDQLVHLRRHKMGMVFQDFALLPHLTVLDNVAFPLKTQGVAKRQRRDVASKMVELVGLGGREGFYPSELSGGQQQRVGIARSLTTEPDIWFLDEPFSALDPLIRMEMQDEFIRLQNLLHKSIVFVTHDFDEAIRLADRIAIMQDGKVIQVASPEMLVTYPATDYVRKFTRQVPRAKVATVGTVMNGSVLGDTARTVRSSSLVCDIAEEVLNASGPTTVADDNGRIVGTISRDDIMDVLLNKDRTS